MLCRTAGTVAASKGAVPVPAKATRQPHAKMSAAAVARWPRISSGAMYEGVPMSWLERVTASAASSRARAMPKSMTFGPTGESSTFAGLRSRWMIPDPWMAVSAAATPMARPSRVPPAIEPSARTASSRFGPGTYSETMKRGSPSSRASITPAVEKRATRRAASTSRAKRSRKDSSSARSGWMSFTATDRSEASLAR